MSDATQEIAARVRVLREIENISVETLARELGFDPADYSAWESGAAEFPIGALVEIAGHFKVDLTELVSGEASRLRTYCVTRADRAPEVSRRPMYTYWNLAMNFHRKIGEPFLVEANPGTEGKPIALNTHPGQEFDYVLEGRLLVSVGGHEEELGPGDCIYYDSSEPHGMKSLGGRPARFLAIVL
ncbi:MAG: cupin domain-containing protein [Spirochaetaceae bacterium]|jgi:quercetin dioxygenase-like cupin family protein|nr:cupin domain-containing protein [Spirochaetaceae bacterium]